MRASRLLTLLQPSDKAPDRRSIGRADDVVALISSRPELFAELISLLWSDQAVVRMRAADAAEKITRTMPALLRPHRKELLGLMVESDQQEICWHLAAMMPRIPLTGRETQLVRENLGKYLKHPSSIVRTFALQGLADLAKQNPSLRQLGLEALQEAERSGTPAMRARSRKLLKELS